MSATHVGGGEPAAGDGAESNRQLLERLNLDTASLIRSQTKWFAEATDGRTVSPVRERVVSASLPLPPGTASPATSEVREEHNRRRALERVLASPPPPPLSVGGTPSLTAAPAELVAPPLTGATMSPVRPVTPGALYPMPSPATAVQSPAAVPPPLMRVVVPTSRGYVPPPPPPLPVRAAPPAGRADVRNVSCVVAPAAETRPVAVASPSQPQPRRVAGARMLWGLRAAEGLERRIARDRMQVVFTAWLANALRRAEGRCRVQEVQIATLQAHCQELLEACADATEGGARVQVDAVRGLQDARVDVLEQMRAQVECGTGVVRKQKADLDVSLARQEQLAREMKALQDELDILHTTQAANQDADAAKLHTLQATLEAEQISSGATTRLLQTELSDLQRQVADAAADRAEAGLLRGKAASLEAECDQLRQTELLLREQFEGKAREVERMTQELGMERCEVSKLQARLSALGSGLVQQQTQEELRGVRGALLGLQEERDEGERRLRETCVMITSKDERIRAADEEIAKQAKAIESLDRALAHAQLEKEGMLKDTAHDKSTAAVAEAQRQAASQKEGMLVKQLDEATDEAIALRTVVSQVKGDLAATQAVLAAKEEAIVHLTATMARLNEELEGLRVMAVERAQERGEFMECKARLADTERQLERSERERDALRDKLEASDARKTELANLSGQQAVELGMLRTLTGHQENEVAKLQAVADEWEAQAKENTHRYHEMAADLTRARAELEVQERRAHDLEGLADDYKAANRRLADDLDSTRRVLDERMQEAAALAHDLRAAESAAETAGTSSQDLGRQLVESNAERDMLREQLKEATERVNLQATDTQVARRFYKAASCSRTALVKLLQMRTLLGRLARYWALLACYGSYKNGPYKRRGKFLANSRRTVMVRMLKDWKQGLAQLLCTKNVMLLRQRCFVKLWTWCVRGRENAALKRNLARKQSVDGEAARLRRGYSFTAQRPKLDVERSVLLVDPLGRQEVPDYYSLMDTVEPGLATPASYPSTAVGSCESLDARGRQVRTFADAATAALPLSVPGSRVGSFLCNLGRCATVQHLLALFVRGAEGEPMGVPPVLNRMNLVRFGAAEVLYCEAQRKLATRYMNSWRAWWQARRFAAMMARMQRIESLLTGKERPRVTEDDDGEGIEHEEYSARALVACDEARSFAAMAATHAGVLSAELRSQVSLTNFIEEHVARLYIEAQQRGAFIDTLQQALWDARIGCVNKDRRAAALQLQLDEALAGRDAAQAAHDAAAMSLEAERQRTDVAESEAQKLSTAQTDLVSENNMLCRELQAVLAGKAAVPPQDTYHAADVTQYMSSLEQQNEELKTALVQELARADAQQAALRTAHDEELGHVLAMKEQAEKELAAYAATHATPNQRKEGKPAVAPAVQYPQLTGFKDEEQQQLVDWASLKARRSELIFAADTRWKDSEGVLLKKVEALLDSWMAVLVSDDYLQLSEAQRESEVMSQQIACGRLALELDERRRDADAALLATLDAFEDDVLCEEGRVRNILTLKLFNDLCARQEEEMRTAGALWQGIGQAVREMKAAELQQKHAHERTCYQDEVTIEDRKRADGHTALENIRAAHRREVARLSGEWASQMARSVKDLEFLLSDHATHEELIVFKAQIGSAWKLYVAQRNQAFERLTLQLNDFPNPFGKFMQKLQLDVLSFNDDKNIAVFEQLSFTLLSRPKLLASLVECYPLLRRTLGDLHHVVDALAQVQTVTSAPLDRILAQRSVFDDIPLRPVPSPKRPRLADRDSSSWNSSTPAKRRAAKGDDTTKQRLAYVFSQLEETLTSVSAAHTAVERSLAQGMTYAERSRHHEVVGGVAYDHEETQKLRDLPCELHEKSTLVKAANILLRMDV